MNTENTVMTVQDLEGARELGRLSGEVRVLKWGAAIVVTMMFAYLTFLTQQISDVRNDLTQQISGLRSDLTQQISEVRSDLTQQIKDVRSDLTQQINDVRSDLTQQINDVRGDLTQQINDVRGDLTGQINLMQEGQAAIRERMTAVEQRLMADSS